MSLICLWVSQFWLVIGSVLICVECKGGMVDCWGLFGGHSRKNRGETETEMKIEGEGLE